MINNKNEYILRSLSKISKKRWEFFIVSRILHGLDDDEIEFVTQQLVRRPDGTRALTDIFFPQFGIHLEIDEPHHKNQENEDFKREQDIIQITNHQIKRIKIPENSDAITVTAKVRDEVDKIIELIKGFKEDAIKEKSFIPWDYEGRYSADPVISRGIVSIKDNVVFRTQVEALRCFGFRGNGWQRGAWIIPDGTHDTVWFPRLYRHGIWHNELTDEGETIYERAIKVEDDVSVYEEGIRSIEKQRSNNSKYSDRKYIVFAKARDALGFNLLRYVGSFKMDLVETDPDVLRFNRISTEEKIRRIP